GHRASSEGSRCSTSPMEIAAPLLAGIINRNPRDDEGQGQEQGNSTLNPTLRAGGDVALIAWIWPDHSVLIGRCSSTATASHPRQPTLRSGRSNDEWIAGRDARMRSEKSGASSAACAASLIRDRRRSSSDGSVVSTRPE